MGILLLLVPECFWSLKTCLGVQLEVAPYALLKQHYRQKAP